MVSDRPTPPPSVCVSARACTLYDILERMPRPTALAVHTGQRGTQHHPWLASWLAATRDPQIVPPPCGVPPPAPGHTEPYGCLRTPPPFGAGSVAAGQTPSGLEPPSQPSPGTPSCPSTWCDVPTCRHLHDPWPPPSLLHGAVRPTCGTCSSTPGVPLRPRPCGCERTPSIASVACTRAQGVLSPRAAPPRTGAGPGAPRPLSAVDAAQRSRTHPRIVASSTPSAEPYPRTVRGGSLACRPAAGGWGAAVRCDVSRGGAYHFVRPCHDGPHGAGAPLSRWVDARTLQKLLASFTGSHLSRTLGIERATQVAHRRRWIESSAGPRRVPCSACWPLAASSRRGAAEVLGFGWRRPGRAHGREDLLGQLGDGAGGAVGGAGGQRAVPYGGGDVGTEVESARAQRRRERACPSHPCTPCTHTVLHTPRTRRLSRRCLPACRGGSNPGF